MEEFVYKNILLQVEQVGIRRAKILIDYAGSAKNVFSLSFKELINIDTIGELAARNIVHHKVNTEPFEKEFLEVQQRGIEIIHYEMDSYPLLLKDCPDAPLLLYKKGNSEIFPTRCLAIIGTRNPSEYARKTTQQLIEHIALYQPAIVSGLAIGVDTFAHQYALQNGLQTFAILGSGVDIIYPNVNTSLSQQIERQGALLSEFKLGTTPDAINFPRRNRIVAGMCEATLVIETAQKGGSMITAALANSYNREVLAVPNKIGETKSEGNLYLIKKNIAKLVCSGKDIAETLGWDVQQKPKVQEMSFFDFSEDELSLYHLIQKNEKIHIDILMATTTLCKEKIPQLLLEMEIKGMIRSLPGKIFATA